VIYDDLIYLTCLIYLIYYDMIYYDVVNDDDDMTNLIGYYLNDFL
jgi:hypothetical protein